MSRFYPNQNDLTSLDKMERTLRRVYDRIYGMEDNQVAVVKAVKKQVKAVSVTLAGTSQQAASTAAIVNTITGGTSSTNPGLTPATPGDGYKFLNGATTATYAFPILHYGSMYGDDIAQIVTVAASDTYYPLTAGLSDGGCSSAFTFQNASELLCAIAGRYLVNWSMTMSTTAPADEIEGAVMVNSTASARTVNGSSISSANKFVGVGGSGLVTLVAGDLLKLSVENETAARDIKVDHANLTAVRIG